MPGTEQAEDRCEQIEATAAQVPCADGEHDFEELPVSDGWGIVVGHSRCRSCGTLADDAKVESAIHSFELGG
jgi:hypothetical protein